MASWYTAEVDKAEAEIRSRVPGVGIERPDYGYGLTAIKCDVGKPGVAVIVKVYQPAREDIGQPEVLNDVEYAIRVLNGWNI